MREWNSPGSPWDLEPFRSKIACRTQGTNRILKIWLVSWLISILMLSAGCRTSAPIYVWQPPQVEVDRGAKIAIAPLMADPLLARAIEIAMLEQRPAIRADLAMLTHEQLLELAPVRLASTAAVLSDLNALQAAQALQADILICGQVYSYDIDWWAEGESPRLAGSNFNQRFFQRLSGSQSDGPDYHLLLSWNIMQVSTGKSLGAEQFLVQSHEVAEKYPDLQHLADQPAYQLITAAARETWRSVAPSVTKERVRLASPWLQPGWLRVQMGNRAAKRGHWADAERHWQQAALWWLPTPAAHHNLAIAHAAKEDFANAKQHLNRLSWPFRNGLPIETPLWLDMQHQRYHQAHGLEPPQEGWAFPEPLDVPQSNLSVETRGF